MSEAVHTPMRPMDTGHGHTDLFGGAFASILLTVTLAITLAVTPAADAYAVAVPSYAATITIPPEHSRASLPVSVTAGAGNGEVCVTDARSGFGHLFNQQNVRVFSTGATAGLSDPMDITVDAQGGFVCTDSRPGGGRTIRRLNFFGEPISYEPEKPQEDWEPAGLLVTSDGNYVTADPSNALIAKHDAQTGALLWKRSMSGQRTDELLGLGRPAEGSDGRLYVPIGGDRRIEVLSADGETQTSFGLPGTGHGRLSFPVGVAMCPDGSIAVLDRMRHTVLLYAADQSFFAEFGEYGAGPRNLYYPVSIAATRDGRIFVAQGFQGRIHLFRVSTTGSVGSTTDRSWLTEARNAGTGSPYPEGGLPLSSSRGTTATGAGTSHNTHPPIHRIFTMEVAE
jgi:DNA-binding beta-propeller fold protein YncE